MATDSPANSDSPTPRSSPPLSPAPSGGGRQVANTAWWLYVALVPCVWLVRLWLATLRIRVAPGKIAAWEAAGNGRIVVFWHNRLLVAAELRRRFSPDIPMNGLVSASKDGAWLASFFNLLGVRAIRGSSSWRGGEAMLKIIRCLEKGEDVAVTPDGPRGPCYHWKGSVSQIASMKKCPVVLVGTRYHCARRLGSWDGFYLPAPFSRVDMDIDIVSQDDPDRRLPEEEFSERLRQRLMAHTNDLGFAWKRKPR